MEKINYETITQALLRLTVPMEGAEFQGILCGHIASSTAEISWLQEMIGERDHNNLQTREDVLIIAQVLGDATRQLNDTELQFNLLLPDTEQPLQQRANTLIAWCEGFLYGYGIASETRISDAQGHEKEVLQDFSEICHLNFEKEDKNVTEEDELNFLEIVEHVRISALLLFEENRPTESQKLTLASETIH